MVRTKYNYESIPSIMAERSHSKVSDRYSFVPTFQVINLLEDNGWYVNNARETNARENKGFQKHIVRLRQLKHSGRRLEVNEIVPEVILTNAHDASTRFNLMAGFERCWCSNQCTVSEGTIRSHKVTHVGYTDEKILEAVYSIVEETPKVINRINDFKSVTLTKDEVLAFGHSSMDLMYDADKWKKINKDISVDRLLLPRRSQDKEPSLWNTFNIIQEKFLQGGRYLIPHSTVKQGEKWKMNLDYLPAKASRKVKSIDKDIKLNRALWTLTEKMHELTLAKV